MRAVGANLDEQALCTFEMGVTGCSGGPGVLLGRAEPRSSLRRCEDGLTTHGRRDGAGGQGQELLCDTFELKL